MAQVHLTEKLFLSKCIYDLAIIVICKICMYQQAAKKYLCLYAILLMVSEMTIKLYSYVAISTGAHSSTLASSRNRTWNRSIPLCHHIAATLFETEESKIPDPPSPPQYITICTYIRIYDHQITRWDCFSKTHMHTWYKTRSQCKLGMKNT